MSLTAKSIASASSSPIQQQTFDTSRLRPLDYFQVMSGLIGLTLFIYWYNIEASLGLFRFMLITVPGFAIYAWVPLRYKMPALFCLSVATILLLFSIPVALGALFVVLCFAILTALPISWSIKVALTVAMFIGLVILRIQLFPTLPGVSVAQVAGVLLMFRSVLFLYEIRYEKTPPSVWRRVNYLIMAPNLIFFLFPIVDYKTFTRELYTRPPLELATKGLQWMLLGLVQFMIYRIMYSYFLPSASEVTDIYGLIQYLFVSYSLILRLSAIFHFAAGVLCLFGFNLPPTFDNYFLATSFGDLWRRINMYWRDFVMKVFYFPIFFKFKKRDSRAIFITILIVFFFNWFMHAYQWFWIRGTFLLQENDIIFWATLGILMAFSAAYQSKKKRKTKLSSNFKLSRAFVNSLRILGMLTAMSLLWVFWISPSVVNWWSLMTGITTPGLKDCLYIILTVLLLAGVGTGLFYLYSRLNIAAVQKRLDSNLLAFFAILGIILLVGSPRAQSQLASNTSFSAASLFSEKLNKQDQEAIFEGYYDQLVVSNNFSGARILGFNKGKNDDWNILPSTGILINHSNSMLRELKPDTSVILKAAALSTNSHGLRDREYALSPTPGQARIALLGGSLEFGTGVTNDQTFENLLENRWNSDSTAGQEIEILNFAIAGTHIPQHVAVTEEKVTDLSPDILIYTAHLREIERPLLRYTQFMRSRTEIADEPFLLKLADSLGINETTTPLDASRLIKPFAEELYHWGLDRIMARCQRDSIFPIFIYLPLPDDEDDSVSREAVMSIAQAKGFHTIDLHNIFAGHDPANLRIAPFDRHPNAQGHRIIARTLYEHLQQDSVFLNEITDIREVFSN